MSTSALSTFSNPGLVSTPARTAYIYKKVELFVNKLVGGFFVTPFLEGDCRDLMAIASLRSQ